MKRTADSAREHSPSGWRVPVARRKKKKEREKDRNAKREEIEEERERERKRCGDFERGFAWTMPDSGMRAIAVVLRSRLTER